MDKINLPENEILIKKSSDSLNEIILQYYKYLIGNMNFYDSKSKEYIYSLIELLDLKEQISNINFDYQLGFSGYYCANSKELTINFDMMLEYYKLDIIDNQLLLLEYFTTLFHELFHAIQYRALEDNKNTTMISMKKISIELKQILSDDILLHRFFPDEREANIESSKIIYNFFSKYYVENFKRSEENLIFYLNDGYSKTINGLCINPMSKLFNSETKFIIEKKYLFENISDYEKILYGFKLDAELQNCLEQSNKSKSLSKELFTILDL